jgi:hypothetical protein
VLENPVAKGTQWTYLGEGRWQYVGDSSLNALQFSQFTEQPDAGYLEFEVESYSGSGLMTCSVSGSNNNGAGIFTSTGIKQYLYKDKGINNNNTVQFKRNSGSITCIIKNISFKPLGTCNPVTLSNTTSENWEAGVI